MILWMIDDGAKDDSENNFDNDRYNHNDGEHVL